MPLKHAFPLLTKAASKPQQILDHEPKNPREIHNPKTRLSYPLKFQRNVKKTRTTKSSSTKTRRQSPKLNKDRTLATNNLPQKQEMLKAEIPQFVDGAS